MRTRKARKPATRSRDFSHVIVDMWIPEVERLQIEGVTKVIKESAKAGRMHIIRVESHDFGPSAFTVFALLSESHIAIHTWPEFEYVACDIFSCSGYPKRSIMHLLRALKPKGVAKYTIARNSPNLAGVRSHFMDDTGPGIHTLFDVKKLHVVQSRFQNIQVLAHQEFGRMLVINNDVQFTERDHVLYDRTLLSPIMKYGRLREILVIGGGDGLCCTYLLENNLADKITLLELDPAVITVCQRYFPALSNGLKSDKVSMKFGDAAKTIRSLPESTFDAVVVDSTAPDSKWGKGTYSPEFFENVYRVMKSGGLLCVNGTSIWFEYEMSAELIASNIASVFEKVSRTQEWIPSFGSPWVFYSARKQ